MKRVRFNEASITVKESNSGDDFEDLPNVIVVYISEFDFLGGGKTIYHVDQVLRETGEVIEDGSKRIFVNTVNDDGSDIADLMSCFTRKQVNNPKFPVFSAEVEDLKQSEGGTTAMCKVMEHYENIAREEGRAEERKLFAEERKQHAEEISKKDAELATLRAQLAALTQRA